MTRRTFGKLCASALGVLAGGCERILGRRGSSAPAAVSCRPSASDEGFDYIVVGSGAGGGPLAANLAKTGFRVLLLEAGGDAEPYTYQVPAFHALASEDERLRWDYFIQHYSDDGRQRQDDKYHLGETAERQGILYPRAGTLGGCTAHNAMITVYPHNSDWDHIAETTGDASWRSDAMRRYFERLERCHYVQRPGDGGADPGRHGFDGWLTTERPDATLAVRDRQLLGLIKSAVKVSFEQAVTAPGGLAGIRRKVSTDFDPNDWRLVTEGVEGLCLTPLATIGGRRNGTREYIRRVQVACPGNLVVKTGALAARVLLDDVNRAIGVEYLEGAHLYRADPGSGMSDAGVLRRAMVKREVILAAGAFNTPQLLQLSGIGPRDELTRNGIDVRVDLPGVGRNLQDRYEVGVVLELREDFSLLEGATFTEPPPGEQGDPVFREWLQGKGPYTTNGAVISVIRRSDPRRAEPDLFIFGLAGRFEGYFPGYSREVTRDRRFFTWAILKGHTNNTAGTVTLRSADPRDVPRIHFHYFDEGSDQAGEDLDSIVEGIHYVRRMVRAAGPLVKAEIVPGEPVRTPEELKEFVKNNAWGHHASCTCKMGSEADPMAVVDSRFRVRGTRNLRVVDASVFPRIPGLFIVTAIYMISEKAADVIVEDARS